MNEVNLFYLLFFFLIILQSIAGVGILLIGTPLLLIFKLDIISILSIIIPISILTSSTNLIYFKFNKEKLDLKLDKDTTKKFFTICIPSIFIGLFFLKQFKDLINFNYLVSFVIFSSILLVNSKKFFNEINNKIRIFFLFIIGLIHGLSNSGGSLLSLFLLYFKNKNQSRFNITFFYFFLASFQYLMFLLIFNQKIYFQNIFLIPILILSGTFIGNYLSTFVREKIYKNLINILCFFTCVILLILN